MSWLSKRWRPLHLSKLNPVGAAVALEVLYRRFAGVEQRLVAAGDLQGMVAWAVQHLQPERLPDTRYINLCSINLANK